MRKYSTSATAAAATALAVLFLGACSARAPGPDVPSSGKLFTLLPASYTGVDFENRLVETQRFNVLTYRNFYDGGGVGIADFSGDGWADIFLTANQQPNRLYLNRGALRFDDVTAAAGVGGGRAWSTGVSIADVDGDGRLDIYVCNSGDSAGDDRANELFINLGPDEDGVPRFEERAAEYGLADTGFSTHAAFFDYDLDGDLDLYLLNNASSPIGGFTERSVRHVRHKLGGDRLLRNDDGHFVDVSADAGIYGSEIGFGLGVTVGDVDGDGRPDVYISNDFFERDYLYRNNGDGTFREELEQWLPHISLSSMGADLADVNNDALPDLFVTDMLPEHDRRIKTTTTFNSWREYQAASDDGFHFQLTRNMLHLHNGNGTFSEIGQLAGVSSTDWSWAALIADLDLDGFKDIFVANGIFRDLTDQDFIASFSTEESLAGWIKENGSDFRKLLHRLPSTPIPNYAFRNNGDLTFTGSAAEWGLDAPGFSNGAAYGDLDNDGDLDLVVNNINEQALIYRNEADSLLGRRYLQVELVGEGRNRFGIGVKVTLHHDGRRYYLEQIPTRGFQSSVEPVLTFGLGEIERIDSLLVVWPDGREQTLASVAADRRLTLRQADALKPSARRSFAPSDAPRVVDVSAEVGLEIAHRENDFVDFDREALLPKMISTEGPRLAVADVDGDGREDVYVGGAKGTPGALLIQQPEGGFRPSNVDVFERDRASEDVGAAFADVDGDGDVDLYVVSGGGEYSAMAPALQDRLYLNNGLGRFEKTSDRLPNRYESGSVVAAADYDSDGDVDLFVGGRVVPWRYGHDAESVLLRNDGTGRYSDVTPKAAPGLQKLGMVTDAVWTDYDGDGMPDLIVVGEWMPVSVFRNAGGGRLEDGTADAGLGRTHGWWNRLRADDLDADGDADLVVGNLGLNTRLHASEEKPLTMHVADFDGNGYAEQIVSSYEDEKSYPIVPLSELRTYAPSAVSGIESHGDYAGRTISEIFSPQALNRAVVKEIHHLGTSVFENRGDGTFARRTLPIRAQFAPVYGILADDFDRDGRKDLLFAGNFFEMRPQIGRMDASCGLLLRGDGALSFSAIAPAESGLSIRGQVRDLAFLETMEHGRTVLVARNDAPVQVLRVLPPDDPLAGRSVDRARAAGTSAPYPTARRPMSGRFQPPDRAP